MPDGNDFVHPHYQILSICLQALGENVRYVKNVILCLCEEVAKAITIKK